MKLFARLVGFTTIGLLFTGILMDMMQENILLRDLANMTSLAVNQTQIVMREQVEDRYFNYDNARNYFDNNDAYYDYFKDCFRQLITSDAKYQSILYDIDYTTGLISVGVDCTYKNIVGVEKTLHTRKTSIIDVLINADTGSVIPGGEAQVLTAPSIQQASYNYDGTDHMLVTGGVASGGVLYYGYSSSNSEAPTNYSKQTPMGRNAGEYYVWYKLKNSSNNHYEYETCLGKVNINPKPITLTWGADNWTYDGSEHQVEVVANGGLATDVILFDIENGTITNAGTQVATITNVKNTNYTLPTTGREHSITVTPIPAEVIIPAYRMEYGDESFYRFNAGDSPEDHPGDSSYDDTPYRIYDKKWEANGLIDGDELTGTPVWTVKNSSGTTISNIKTAEVGLYKLSLSGLTNSNYNITFLDAELEVKKKKNYLNFASNSTLTCVQGGEVSFSAATNSKGELSYALYTSKDSSGTTAPYFSVEGNKIIVDDSAPAGNYVINVEAYCTGNDNYSFCSKHQIIQLEITQRQVAKGDIINIEGDPYRVLSLSGTNAKVIAMNDATTMSFNDTSVTTSFGGSVGQKYEGSNVDNYLENTWFAGLSQDMKDAIVPQNITQNMYRWNSTSADASSWYKNDFTSTDTSGTSYTIAKVGSVLVGSRHVYVLDIEDVINYLGSSWTPQQLNIMLWNVNHSIPSSYTPDFRPWLRSADADSSNFAWRGDGGGGFMKGFTYNNHDGVRPAFVIDLSKVEYTVE